MDGTRASWRREDSVTIPFVRKRRQRGTQALPENRMPSPFRFRAHNHSMSLMLLMALVFLTPAPAQQVVPELMKREVSREGAEYLEKLRKRTPFGTNEFNL